MPRRRAFTLIELLVVIGIIAILASLTTAAVGRMRDQGHRSRCANHLRQLNTAVMLYVAENNGFLPFPNDDGSNAQWRAPGWLYNDLWGRPLRQEQVRQGVLWQYHKDESVYHCPADTPPYQGLVAGRNSHELTSYQMNWAVGENGRGTEVNFRKVPAFKLSRMPPMGIVFWEGDETIPDVHMWSDGTNEPHNGLTRRHGLGATVTRFDGSATWITRAEYDKMVTSTRRSPLWCNPASPNGR